VSEEARVKDGKKDQDDRGRALTPREAKRPYTTPRLTEYGSVAKLTQGFGSLQADGGSTFKRTCL
jgi:hypothetical protein